MPRTRPPCAQHEPDARAGRDDEAGRSAHRAALLLARRLTALPTPAMRETVLLEWLETAAPADAVRLLDRLTLDGRGQSEPAWASALITLATALATDGRLPYPVRTDLYEAAREAGLDTVARLFLSTTCPAATASTRASSPAPERALTPTGPPITLGQRKALARGRRRDLLAQLACDADPQVIRVLLDNPRLIERDVVAIAARRPGQPAVLRVVFESRWLVRRSVMRALVMNPRTPTDLGVRLCAALSGHDLAKIAEDESLAEPVRAQARQLALSTRRGDG